MRNALRRHVDPDEIERFAVWRSKKLQLENLRSSASKVPSSDTDVTLESTKVGRNLNLVMEVAPADEKQNFMTSFALNTGKRSSIFLFFSLFLLPVCLVAIYLIQFATPLYEAQTTLRFANFQETLSDPDRNSFLAAAPEGQNAFIVQAYFQSTALMDELNENSEVTKQFRTNAIDPLKRIWNFPYFPISERGQFDKFLYNQVDVQTGLITLHTRATSREDAAEFAKIVISLTEDHLWQRYQSASLFELNRAENEVQLSLENLSTAQRDLSELRKSTGIYNLSSHIQVIEETIGTLEQKSNDLEHEMRILRIAGRTNTHRYQQLIDVQMELTVQIEELRLSLVAEGSIGQLTQLFENANQELEIARSRVSDAKTSLGRNSNLVTNQNGVLEIVVPTSSSAQIVTPNVIGTMLFSLIFFGAIHRFVRLIRRKSSIE